MADANKRLWYISVPALIGTAINLLMFYKVFYITMQMPKGTRIQITDFVLLVVYIVYAIIINSTKALNHHAGTVVGGAFSGNIATLISKYYLNFFSQYAYPRGFNGIEVVTWIFRVGILLPHVLYFFKACRINKQISERERIAENQRREQQRLIDDQRREQERREREQWERNIASQIDNAFLRASDRTLNTVLTILENSKGNHEQYNFIKKRVILRSDAIYEMSVTKIETGNFSDAITGLKILTMLNPNEQKYQTAINRLTDKKAIINIMDKKGLPESSQVFKNHFTGMLASKV